MLSADEQTALERGETRDVNREFLLIYRNHNITLGLLSPNAFCWSLCQKVHYFSVENLWDTTTIDTASFSGSFEGFT